MSIDKNQQYKQSERTLSQSQLTQTETVNHQDSTKEYFRQCHENQKRRANKIMDGIKNLTGK